jgi:hypothetical protein
MEVIASHHLQSLHLLYLVILTLRERSESKGEEPLYFAYTSQISLARHKLAPAQKKSHPERSGTAAQSKDLRLKLSRETRPSAPTAAAEHSSGQGTPCYESPAD